MNEKLYDLMNWADVEEVTYAESTNPRRILGPRMTEEGLLIQAYLPTAKAITVKLSGKNYPMDQEDESGFFAVLIPGKKTWEKKLPDYLFEITYDNDDVAETEDPYAFDSIFTDEDLKKFGAGIHYRIYQKMGAHAMTRDGVPGVNFSVWAPNALRVSVVGDFNMWDGRRHQMEKLGDSGIFEIFIPRLPVGTIYKFEIKKRGQDSFLKTDPYGFGFELRPNTAAVVTDPTEYHWTDDAWQDQKEEGGQKERPMAVYELHLGSFARKQAMIDEDGSSVNGSEFYNYRELADKVSQYVKKEGYTHVELMPVMEHPLDQSWGYQVSGYYAPTSRYGSASDFKYFVDTLHKEGIGVILDWVPAHFPRDTWGLAQFDGTALYENPDPMRGSHPHWGTLIFNYARYEVSNFLIANAFYWADQFHADGIRMDAVASMLYLDYGRQGQDAPRNMYGGNENLEAVEFLKHLNSQFKKAFPGTLLIAEESTAWPNVTGPVESDGLGFDLKWNMGWMNDFLSYMETDPFFRKGSYNKLTFSMLYNYSEDFQLVFSHDEVVHGKGSMLGKMPGKTFEEKAQNLRAAYGYFYGHPGKKLLFMAQDFGQYSEWNESQEIEWNLLEYPVHQGIQDYVKDLNELYKTHPALSRFDYYPDGFEWINCSYGEQSLLFFLRKTDVKDETILVAANFDNVEHKKFRVGVPFPCKVKPLLSSDEKKYGGSGALRKIEHKAEKLEWDEREYSVVVDIPAMSTVIFSLTEIPEEEVPVPTKKDVKAKRVKAAESMAAETAAPAKKSSKTTKTAAVKKAAGSVKSAAEKTVKTSAKTAKAAVAALKKEKDGAPENAIKGKSTRSKAPAKAHAVNKRRKG